MTVSSVIKEILDYGITTESAIYSTLTYSFPDIEPERLFNRVRPGISYFKNKELPKVEIAKSEFNIKGQPIDSMYQNKLIEVLRLVKEKTDLRIPEINWTNGKRCKYRRPSLYNSYHGDFIMIAKRSWSIIPFNFTNFLGVVLHELVHANGFYGHNDKFFNKLTSVGIKCSLNLSKWFNHEYKSGNKFYNENVRPKLDKLVLDEWEKK